MGLDEVKSSFLILDFFSFSPHFKGPGKVYMGLDKVKSSF